MMKKLILGSICILALQFTSFSQDMGKKILNLITECNCDEIIMISGGLEKVYRSEWKQNVELEDHLIKFTKGDTQHFWNPEDVVYIERTTRYIRFYFKQVR